MIETEIRKTRYGPTPWYWSVSGLAPGWVFEHGRARTRIGAIVAARRARRSAGLDDGVL